MQHSFHKHDHGVKVKKSVFTPWYDAGLFLFPAIRIWLLTSRL